MISVYPNPEGEKQPTFKIVKIDQEEQFLPKCSDQLLIKPSILKRVKTDQAGEKSRASTRIQQVPGVESDRGEGDVKEQWEKRDSSAGGYREG